MMEDELKAYQQFENTVNMLLDGKDCDFFQLERPYSKYKFDVS